MSFVLRNVVKILGIGGVVFLGSSAVNSAITGESFITVLRDSFNSLILFALVIGFIWLMFKFIKR